MVGPWRTGAAEVVDPIRVAAFAAAVGETDDRLRSGAVVPTTYAVTLGWRLQDAVLDRVLPPEVLGLHGEHSFRFHAPLVPGSTVVTRARLQSVIPRRTGTTVTVLSQTSTAEELVVEQLFTVFAVGVQLGQQGEQMTPWPEPAVAAPTDLVARDTVGSLTEEIGPDVPRRYADAADDHYAIHLDDDAARRLGLPGVIVHGMCTLAYAARHLRQLLETDELTALRCRFRAPVVPGTAVRTTVGAPVAGVAAFTTSAANGELVLTGAAARVESSAGGRWAPPATSECSSGVCP